MADTKVSALAAATAVAAANEFPINEAGVSKKVTATQIKSFAVPSGTSFPGSPAADDRFWRTDLDREYFWNSVVSRWLSSQTFTVALNQNAVLGTTSDMTFFAPIPSTYGTDVYLVGLSFAFWGGATNDASNYWTYTFQKVVASVASALVSGNSSGLAAATWVQGYFDQKVIIAGLQLVQVTVVKTGTPGGSLVPCFVEFRLALTT